MLKLNLNHILKTLQNLEPRYHAAYPDATEADFERLVSPDFWEVGASGNTYSREFALNALKNREAPPPANMWQTSDYAVKQVSADVFLLSYTLTQPMRVTKRVTIWQSIDNQWQVIYHQGTVVND